MLGFFTLENAVAICMGACGIVLPVGIYIHKLLSYNAPQVFKTTEYKKKFKKHQIQFNEEFKQNKLFK